VAAAARYKRTPTSGLSGLAHGGSGVEVIIGTKVVPQFGRSSCRHGRRAGGSAQGRGLRVLAHRSASARRMIEEIRGAHILDGVRGNREWTRRLYRSCC
jgi:hypothetical protein